MESNKVVIISSHSICCARKYNPGKYEPGEFKGYQFEDMSNLQIIDNKTISFNHNGVRYTMTADEELGSQPFATLMEDYENEHKIAAARPILPNGVYERPSMAF